MRTLFLKIFLWFWLTNALLVGVLVTAYIWASGGDDPVRMKSLFIMLSRGLSVEAESAIAAFDRGGASGLKQFQARSAAENRFDTRLLNATGSPMADGAASIGAEKVVAAAMRSGEIEVDRTPVGLVAALPLRAKDGRSFVVAGRFPPPFGPLTHGPRTLVPVVAAVLLTAGCVCYGMVRYLTAPVRRLSAAARRIARGDLDARAGPTPGRRDELGDLELDFDHMAERIATLMRTQQTLFWDISHELRSPLARLSVASGLARRRSSDQLDPLLDQFDRDIGRLEQLISRLLMLAKLESGSAVNPTSAIDLESLLREVAADAEFEAAGRGCRVRVTSSQCCLALGTSDLVRSAIDNVVRNAIAHAPPESEIELSLRVELGATGRMGLIAVRDHGPGVPDSQLGDIFRPFYRGGSGDRSARTGAGLGLAIAERAMRTHGGSVHASNAETGGLLVELRIPAEGRTGGEF